MYAYYNIERLIVENLLHPVLIKADDLAPPTSSVERALAETQARIADLTTRIDRLLDAVEAGGADVARRLAQRREEREAARKAEQELLQRSTPPATDHRQADLYAKDRERRFAARTRARMLLQEMLTVLLFYPDGDLVMATGSGHLIALHRDGEWANGMLPGHVAVALGVVPAGVRDDGDFGVLCRAEPDRSPRQELPRRPGAGQQAQDQAQIVSGDVDQVAFVRLWRMEQRGGRNNPNLFGFRRYGRNLGVPAPACG